jgi:hypothetical protein
MRHIISILAFVIILTTVPATFVLGGISDRSLQPAIDATHDSSRTLIPIQRVAAVRSQEIRLARVGFGIGLGFGLGGGGIVGGYVGIPSGRSGVYFGVGPGLGYYGPGWGYYHDDWDYPARGGEYYGKSGNPDYWDWSGNQY